MKQVHKFWHVPFILLKHLIAGPAILGLGVLLTLLGIIFVTLVNGSFWIIGVGIPVIVVGSSFIVYGLYDLIFGFFSSHHQLIDCPFCQNQMKIKPKSTMIKCKNCGNSVNITKGVQYS